jgi:hypothetical protein
MEIKPFEISHFREILSKFIENASTARITRTGSGHIHETYLVQISGVNQNDYILQKINHRVFPDVDLLMHNIYRVTNHILLREKATKTFVPELIKTKAGNLFHKTAGGEYWRLYRHISDSISYDIVPNEKVAAEAGSAYGRFIEILSDFPIQEIKPVIADFHSLENRYALFQYALQKSGQQRLKEAGEEILLAHEWYKKLIVLEELEKEGKFPARITHNDTKINNVLFNRQDEAISVIDLDTVMPGILLHDFGDAIRTAAAVAAEDEENLNRVDIDLGIFEAFSKGFLHSLRKVITPGELKYLPASVSYITFIMGLRFLTDFLNNDIYFAVHKEKHNLIRARAQFRLLDRSDEKLSRMNSIIQKLFNNLSS